MWLYFAILPYPTLAVLFGLVGPPLASRLARSSCAAVIDPPVPVRLFACGLAIVTAWQAVWTLSGVIVGLLAWAWQSSGIGDVLALVLPEAAEAALLLFSAPFLVRRFTAIVGGAPARPVND